MSTSIKWIVGLSLAVVALVAGTLVLGNPLAGDTEPLVAEMPVPDGTQPDEAVGEGEYYANDPVPLAERTTAANAQDAAAYEGTGPFVIKRVLPIEGPIRYGEWHWDEEGVPDGPLVMTVDLQARVISVFRGGYEIGAAAALLGTEAHPTPTGVFPVLTKERHNVSEKYNNAPMPWTLRLTWDGIAIHGGSTVELGYASHGCIGVPDEFVSRLYDIAKVGDVVIITDGVRTGVGGSLEHGA